MKTAIVTPIHKKGDIKDPGNYRPISVLPVASKLLERLLADQILEHLNKNKILSCVQHGYRKSYSTTTSLVQILEDVRKSTEKREISAILALDLTRAFDTISHKLLIKKLRKIGFSNESLQLMSNYLNNREQFVKVNDIIRCKGENNYTQIFLKEGKPVLVSKTLKDYEEILSEDGFLRIHQSHLINKHHVLSFEKRDGGYLKMADGSSVSISRQRKEFVLSVLNK